MDADKILTGRRVLIVDDEQDVLDTLVGLLDMCKLDTAASFDQAKTLMESNDYDLAVLDIMGVRGFDLLQVAQKRNIPALMLTAHSLTSESLKKSAEDGAAYFAPKDKMSDITIFAADVIESKDKKKSPWIRVFDRLGGFYDRKFGGTDWREKEKKFWEEKTKALW